MIYVNTSCAKEVPDHSISDDILSYEIEITTLSHNGAVEPSSNELPQMQLEIVQISGLEDVIRENNINLAFKMPLIMAVENAAYHIKSSAELHKNNEHLISVCYVYQMNAPYYPSKNCINTVNIKPDFYDVDIIYNLVDVVKDIDVLSWYLLENKFQQLITFTGGIDGEDIRDFNESTMPDEQLIKELSQKLISRDSDYWWYVSVNDELVICVNDGQYYYKYFLDIRNNIEIFNTNFVEVLS